MIKNIITAFDRDKFKKNFITIVLITKKKHFNQWL